MPKKKLPVKAFTEDLRSGMDDAGLMAKYELTESKLRGLLNKLVGMEVLSASDIERRPVPDHQSSRTHQPPKPAPDHQPAVTPQPSRPAYRFVCPNCRTYSEADEPICPHCKVIVWLSCAPGAVDET